MKHNTFTEPLILPFYSNDLIPYTQNLLTLLLIMTINSALTP